MKWRASYPRTSAKSVAKKTSHGLHGFTRIGSALICEICGYQSLVPQGVDRISHRYPHHMIADSKPGDHEGENG